MGQSMNCIYRTTALQMSYYRAVYELYVHDYSIEDIILEEGLCLVYSGVLPVLINLSIFS